MKVRDLTDKDRELYCVCLEDWSDDMREAGNHKCEWYEKMKSRGLRVKLAEDDVGTVGGMIQYVPTEHSFVEGKDAYIVLCIWVHGYNKGRGDFRHQGMGSALLHAAEEDAKALGASGLATWGLSVPAFMQAKWFKKHGYQPVDKEGVQVLLWKPFKDDAIIPKIIRQKKSPEKVKNKVIIHAFNNGWCPSSNLTYERAKRAVKEFEHSVEFIETDTSERGNFLEWGLMDALYIDGKEISSGPPLSYDKILKTIEKKVRKIK